MIPKLGVDMTTDEADECIRRLTMILGVAHVVRLALEGGEETNTRLRGGINYRDQVMSRLLAALDGEGE